MRLHLKLEVLAVLLLLTPIISDAVRIPRCDLMNQLLSAFSKEPKSEDLVAKIICYVENTSEFDTKAIHEINPQGDHEPRKTRAVPRKRRSNPKLPEKSIETSHEASTPPPNTDAPSPQPKTSTSPPRLPVEPRHRRNPQSENTFPDEEPHIVKAALPAPNSTETVIHQYEEEHSVKLGTLYGVFWLDCDMCNLKCQSLMNEDIADDIQCLERILYRTYPDDQGSESHGLIEQWNHMFWNTHTCSTAVYEGYFDDCTKP